MWSFGGSAFCPKEGNGYSQADWDGLEQPNSQYDPRGRELSWDYSDVNISYEGSYLTATSGTNGNVVSGYNQKGKI